MGYLLCFYTKCFPCVLFFPDPILSNSSQEAQDVDFLQKLKVELNQKPEQESIYPVYNQQKIEDEQILHML